MILFVAGSLDNRTQRSVFKAIGACGLLPWEIDLVVHGDQAGADRGAMHYARQYKIETETYSAKGYQRGSEEWKSFFRTIIEDCDACLILKRGICERTDYLIEVVKESGKQHYLYDVAAQNPRK